MELFIELDESVPEHVVYVSLTPDERGWRVRVCPRVKAEVLGVLDGEVGLAVAGLVDQQQGPR
jgi:hypothetical protein